MGYIYLRKNLSNGKCYVGQAKDVKDRNQHWKSLNERYGGYIINNARKKYGVDGFSFEILKECPNEEMNYWEMYYIKEYNSKAPNGYNMTDGGDSVYERTEETIKKMSDAHRGKKRPDISAALRGRKRPDIADALRGKKLSDETKAKLSAALRGKKRSAEVGAKIAAAKRGKHYPKLSAALRGRKLSPEHIEKHAAALRGKKQSEETKAKLSAAHRGMKHSEETKKKIGDAHRGKKLSEETKTKIADAKSKTVQALDKITGEVVFTFLSTAEAGRYGFNQGHVAACCRGEEKAHKGLIWRYSEK